MIKIKAILKELDVVAFSGNEDVDILHPIAFDPENQNASVLMWVNDKNIGKLSALEAGTVLCSDKIDVNVPGGVNLIKVENPRNAFRIVLEKFFSPKRTPAISASARIDASVKIGANAFIGENVVIEEGCIIGDNVEVNHNTVLLANTVIGNDVKIGSNNTIGGVGFGYEKDQDGTFVLIPHLGNVVLMDHVHIGNNTTIDRAVLGSTILQENVKIDNLVHIAHGVNIGQNSLVIANAMVAGSCVVGKNVWISPSSSILNKVNIDDNALVGMGAVVVKKVNESEIVVGNPAKPLIKK